MTIRWHLDDPALLTQAVTSTATVTGYNARLVEKDYFCSVALEYLSTSSAGITFKGGTCLAKIHGNLYRLSEDLDFTVSTTAMNTRAERHRSIAGAKAAFAGIPSALAGFRITEPLVGANNSSQYNGAVGYESLIDGHVEPIRIEISLAEETVEPVERGAASTVVLNPITGRPLVPTFGVDSFSYREVMAEKFRAALCRREVAIRDYFDVDHAVHFAGFEPLESGFIEILRKKIAVPRTGAINMADQRMTDLQRQLDAQLAPVLRMDAFEAFDLQRAVATVHGIALELERR